MSRVFWTFGVLGLVVLVGCTDGLTDGGIIEDKGFNLFTDSGFLSVVPEEYTVGQITTLTVFLDTPYAGVANFEVSGHGGGNVVGEMSSPAQGPVGYLVFQTRLEPGRNLLPLEIVMLFDHTNVAFSIYASLDSLFYNEDIVHWQSEEGRSLWENDIPPNTVFIGNRASHHVDIDRLGSE